MNASLLAHTHTDGTKDDGAAIIPRCYTSVGDQLKLVKLVPACAHLFDSSFDNTNHAKTLHHFRTLVAAIPSQHQQAQASLLLQIWQTITPYCMAEGTAHHLLQILP